MKNYPLSPSEILVSFWKNYDLIKELIKRDISSRYRGSSIGVLWSFLYPLLMLGVYTFVFGIVFKSRWSVESTSKTEFALLLFAGLIIFNLFAECINRAPTLILSNTNYVKKVVFTLEILPWVILGSAVFHALISWMVWLVSYCIFVGIPSLTILLLPIAILPFLAFVLGLCWWLCSLGVYLRDISQIVGVFVTMMMFLAPIFYPLSSVQDELFRKLLYLNPLTITVEQVRDLMFWGKIPDGLNFLIFFLFSLVIAYAGFSWFQKTRKGFADVI